MKRTIKLVREITNVFNGKRGFMKVATMGNGIQGGHFDDEDAVRDYVHFDSDNVKGRAAERIEEVLEYVKEGEFDADEAEEELRDISGEVDALVNSCSKEYDKLERALSAVGQKLEYYKEVAGIIEKTVRGLDAMQRQASKNIVASRFDYGIDLDERGEFKAHVDNPNGKEVFTIEGFDIFEDGFMRNKKDLRGLQEYLIDLGIMKKGDKLTDGTGP